MPLSLEEELTTPLEWSEYSLKKMADWEEENILQPIGLTHKTYSSARMTFRDKSAQCHWMIPNSANEDFTFGIECLPESLTYLATDNGVSLRQQYDKQDIVELCELLTDACLLIRNTSPPLRFSAVKLLRCVHLLNSPGDEYDVSFSLPGLPNSIFLSVPPASDPVAALRLAEAITHEVLHLQLSLVEHFSKLVDPDARTVLAYAPWRREQRPLDGVLHGLFVFRSLELFWETFAVKHSGAYQDFALGRVEEIKTQINSVQVPTKATLTRFGSNLFNRLKFGR